MLSLERAYPVFDEAEHADPVDVILIMGGGLNLPLAPANRVQLHSASDRYWYATKLSKALDISQIIITGGNVFAQQGMRSEAYYARELLVEWGLPEKIIQIEEASRTTAQNTDFTSTMLQELNVKSVLVVSSARHLPRSLSLLERQNPNITFMPAPCDFLILDKHSPWFYSVIPSVDALSVSTMALHEYYGMLFNWLKARISS